MPFYRTNNPKNQHFVKIKKLLEISSFYSSVPKIIIICYTVTKIWHMTDVIAIFQFGLFYALLLPWQLEKLKFNKKKSKKSLRYHHFTYVYQKLWSDEVWFLRYGAWWTDGQMGRWEKWHIEAGATPKNTHHTPLHT